ncbi:hypothetical protein Scep_014901 [Stephania cephalantha]|uniref:Uncharacterized protein n=1 Tax=Stephania cephalantha TaxID=152367 RepID=A0AAP0P292_9MAGN
MTDQSNRGRARRGGGRRQTRRARRLRRGGGGGIVGDEGDIEPDTQTLAMESATEKSFASEQAGEARERRDYGAMAGSRPGEDSRVRTQAIESPEHCVEYMRLYGLLDLDLNDPDLAPLFK